jgi:hypothetical protein
MKRYLFPGLYSAFRATYAILCITAVLIYAVYLRSAGQQVFYKIRTAQKQESRIKQSLWQKQIELEGLVNPASISQHTGVEKGKPQQ